MNIKQKHTHTYNGPTLFQSETKMAQFEHLGHRIGPAEVQEEHARGQPHQASNKEPMRGTKLMSNKLTGELE